MKCQIDVCHILLYFACLFVMIPHTGFCDSVADTLTVHDTGMVPVTVSQTDNDTCNNASDVTSVATEKDMKPLSSDTETPGKTGQSLNKKRLFIISGAAVAVVAVIGIIAGLAGGDDDAKSDTEPVVDRPPGDPVIGGIPDL